MAKTNLIRCVLIAMALSVAAAAHAGPIQPIALKNGVNSFKVKQLQMRIVQGEVGSISGHGFTTYAVYTLTDDAEQKWLQLSFMNRNGPVTYSLNTSESADSNVQSVRFYKKDDQLYAIVAVKTGAQPPDLYTKKTKVQLQTYHFNEDPDTPFMTKTDAHDARNTYMDAEEAIKAEGMVN